MANTILTITMITREALRVLHQQLNFVGNVYREYDDSFAVSGAKIGSNLNIRLPNQYTVRTGATLSTQDTTEQMTTLSITNQKGVDLNFTSVDLTLSMDDFSKRVLKPAMSVLAASIESDAMSMYADIYNQVNNQGNAASSGRLLAGMKILTDNLAPMSDRIANLNTQDNVDLVDAYKGLFQDSSSIAAQYKSGMMGRTASFDFYQNTLWPIHPRGAGNTGYTTNTQVGTLPITSTAVTAITVATGTGAMPKGEIFTIANVFRVHPETKNSTGVLQQFTVTAAYAGGGGSVSISPSIILAGAYQTVIIPTTSATAAVTIAGTASTSYPISMLFHPEAFTFATADLLMPKGVHYAAREVMDGISLRIVQQYDITNDKFPCRLDVLYGYKTIRPQLACRFANN